MENHFDKQAREWDRRSYRDKMVSYLNPGGQLFIAELEPDHGVFHSSNIGVTHMDSIMMRWFSILKKRTW
jgi:hypothetical protein